MLKLILVFTLLMFSDICLGQWRLLEIDEFSMEYWRIEDQRDGYTEYNKPRTEGEQWVGGTAANFDLALMSYKDYSVYWDNKVFMNGTNSQVRHAGWQWEFGLGLGKKLDLFWYHNSQHVLDDVVEDERFPLINRYGFRYVFILKPDHRNRR